MNKHSQDIFFEKYLSGKELFGDNFTQEQINEWYEDEINSGYENLVFSKDIIYEYEYHALNIFHGFDHIKFDVDGLECLCFGSPSGDEVIPILNKIKTLDLLDASDGFNKIANVPIHYSKPNSSGAMPYQDDSFDLITCIGVLHHIPNVSYVISELRRVLRPGGYILIREPITSMGDWRSKRQNVTLRERGIPEKIFIDVVANNFKKYKSKLLRFSTPAKII